MERGFGESDIVVVKHMFLLYPDIRLRVYSGICSWLFWGMIP